MIIKLTDIGVIAINIDKVIELLTSSYERLTYMHIYVERGDMQINSAKLLKGQAVELVEQIVEEPVEQVKEYVHPLVDIINPAAKAKRDKGEEDADPEWLWEGYEGPEDKDIFATTDKQMQPSPNTKATTAAENSQNEVDPRTTAA
ncbi:hypothetical protein ACH5RR_041595 [Cinchona calisaya]|uniref:Uncharacterized protein n=1 Tax=Cinchona calisaya TaxID=153742 RepID=A0ABD2XV83_9GENT